jgi:hypothetical protein
VSGPNPLRLGGDGLTLAGTYIAARDFIV